MRSNIIVNPRERKKTHSTIQSVLSQLNNKNMCVVEDLFTNLSDRAVPACSYAADVSIRAAAGDGDCAAAGRDGAVAAPAAGGARGGGVVARRRRSMTLLPPPPTSASTPAAYACSGSP